jgi:hypothetical protein
MTSKIAARCQRQHKKICPLYFSCYMVCIVMVTKMKKRSFICLIFICFDTWPVVCHCSPSPPPILDPRACCNIQHEVIKCSQYISFHKNRRRHCVRDDKNTVGGRYIHRHTEWQRPLSGVHSIMMEKIAKAGEGGECTPTPFHYIYHHVQSCSVLSSWVGRYTHPISSLPMYSVDTSFRANIKKYL